MALIGCGGSLPALAAAVVVKKRGATLRTLITPRDSSVAASLRSWLRIGPLSSPPEKSARSVRLLHGSRLPARATSGPRWHHGRVCVCQPTHENSGSGSEVRDKSCALVKSGILLPAG